MSYFMEGSESDPKTSGIKCKLKPGVTYYVNFSLPTGVGQGGYDILYRGLDANTTTPMYGIYKTWEDYVAKQFTANISSTSAE